MVIRIDPRIPVVWRTPDTLQLGVDRPIIVGGLSTALEVVVAALCRGIPLAAAELLGVDAGATAEQVQALLGELGPSLIDTLTVAPPAGPRTQVAIDGIGPTATRLRGLLTDVGLVVLPGSHPEPGQAEARISVAVVLGHYALLPGRHRFWLRRDIPHLPVVFSDREVRIGPLVTPGRGPCLHCLDLTLTDIDAAWPRIASQLQGREAPTETTRLSIDVSGRTAAYVQQFLSDHRSPLFARSLALDERSGALTLLAHRAHASCGCRALPRNGTDPGVRAAPAQTPPSSAPVEFGRA